MSNEETEQVEKQIQAFKDLTPDAKDAFLTWIYDMYLKPTIYKVEQYENHNTERNN